MAIKIMDALDESKQIDLISKYLTALTVQDAYCIAQEIEHLRVDRKEYTVGLKVGFTNRNIWKEYNASSPIVGAMYNTTVKMIDKTFSTSGLIKTNTTTAYFHRQIKCWSIEQSKAGWS